MRQCFNRRKQREQREEAHGSVGAPPCQDGNCTIELRLDGVSPYRLGFLPFVRPGRGRFRQPDGTGCLRRGFRLFRVDRFQLFYADGRQRRPLAGITRSRPGKTVRRWWPGRRSRWFARRGRGSWSGFARGRRSARSCIARCWCARRALEN